ncbi:thymidylate synthase, partial [Faecalibaculum rodentium]|uniref:thymidylate synthase n=1 Tax=Faecalibaculum rodentium TaxID=1702221 RepID=UPI0026087FF6
DTAVLPPCVWSTEWDITDGRLNLWVHQRSCDVPLGLPFNVAQYAVLLMMIAQVTGLEPGTMDWSIKDAHIYVDQVEGMKEQLRRWQEEEPKPAPTLWIDPAITEFEDFDSSTACTSVKLENYEHMGKLRFALTQ